MMLGVHGQGTVAYNIFGKTPIKKMFLVNWSLGLLFKRIIRSLEKLIVVRVWVSSKRWVRSHVVTGGFFGKLEISMVNICDKYYD